MAKKTYFAAQALLAKGWASNVSIEVDDGVISAITENTTAGADQVVHLSGPVIATVANLHSHAFQRAMAGLAEISLNPNDSFWSWRDLMYKMVQKLTPDDVCVIAKQLYTDMLKAGYTQVAEFHYLHHQSNGSVYQQLDEMARQLIQAANDSGIGITLLPVLYSHSGFGGQAPLAGQSRFINSTDQYLALHQASEKALADNPLHRLGVCFHSLRAVTKQQIECVLANTSSSMPVHIHISEQQKEVKDCIQWSGQRPVQWLANEIGIDQRWCLIHATHLADDELHSIASSGAVAGLCPTTEANLGDGIFPATEYIQNQGRWGIGSDSHVSLSVVEELRTLEYGQRLRDQQRNRLHNEQHSRVGDFLFQQAVQGGNQATHVKFGLDVGNRADFMVLDHNNPFIAASKSEDILNRWLFACNENVIRHVYVAGEAVIVDFRHAQEEQINSEFSAVLKRLFNFDL
jgi:formimidoylglutamate deiminase